MKSLKRILLILFIGINLCQAQDTTVMLSPVMYDVNRQDIFISTIDGWFFKEGNDLGWAKKDIDIVGWRKLKPTELSPKYADKSGRVECWFRIKIKLDTAFGDQPLGYSIITWAATDLYINGKLIASYGNTGQNGNPFRESSPLNHSSVPVNLLPGNEYTIALHFVDYLSPFPPHRLKSQDVGAESGSPITLTGPEFSSSVLKSVKEITWYSGIWVSVCTILSLLFWLLSIQNSNEKNLRLIALCITFFTLNLFCNIIPRYSLGISYRGFTLYSYASSLFITMFLLIMPLILVHIFKRKVTGILKSFLVILFLISVSGLFLPWGWLVPIVSFFPIIAVCIYYIVSSWKNLKGAQWAIVAGLLSSLIWGILFFLMVMIKYAGSSFPFPHAYLYITGIYLSFPLSLMVYVAMRFKEIINEVQQNAKQVVQLSEEKKEQAVNQQKILQEEVNRQTAEIRNTLDNLKATQSQLIQSEKMASLGELTAGIAHEIQNPLNFVNNFSEVNKELLIEMKDEIEKGNMGEVKAIASDVIDNEEKIIFHGKRADAIVKGMLQHSRSSSGVKEPTDINALCDEYLRLSYHGLRAKDKSFNATMKTDFDNSIGNINIIPQDIGRVILNLLTNAFYAVDEKKKSGIESYEPTVSVSTKKIGSKVEIKVSDNGNGIPQKVLDKIFQPFFTTKPTGQGTGLGLSLAYDIVKAQGGEIKVQSKEGEGTTFIIVLTS